MILVYVPLGEFLLRHDALPKDRIVAVETGGCPHAAIREDITANLIACEDLTAKHDCDIIILESGGDNLAADFSRELADFTIYVIDTAGGDKIPRKGKIVNGMCINQCSQFVSQW